MLLIKNRVAPSAIHGLGVFAAEEVPAGTPVWKFQPDFDREFTPAALDTLPPEAVVHLRWFAYCDAATGNWVLSGDHACFMNHSGTPNTGAIPGANGPVITVALRNIAPGEELTCDYFAFDREAMAKLCGESAGEPRGGVERQKS